MSKFITLTRPGGEDVSINFERVNEIHEAGRGGYSLVYFNENDFTQVTESRASIIDRLNSLEALERVVLNDPTEEQFEALLVGPALNG